MIKYFAILAHLFGFMVLGVSLDDGVIIEDNTPTSMVPGATQEVSITINKGDVEGFAKLQLELPNGLTAEAGDTEGASFTFSGQKVKFIWMSLPESQEFTVTYKLKAAADAEGKKVINGTFSYIKNNQRVDYEMQSKMVEINGSGSPLTNTAPEFDNLEIDGLACVRTITDLGDDRYLVRLDVVNASLEGFGKIKENLPPGYVAEENDSDGAVVTIENSSVKYIWFEVPTEPYFSVSYNLTGAGVPEIEGMFSYVENNAPREMPILSNGVVEAEVMASVPDTNGDDAFDEQLADGSTETETETETETGTEMEMESGSDVAQTETETETETKTENETEVADTTEDSSDRSGSDETTADTQEKNPVTSVPDPETGVTYKVQIVAAHRVVGEEYFASRHGFNENFGIENHEGWVKYTTGTHNVYKSARDDRERIRDRYNFRGPFVTAYNYGERITVQEALMISKQKWYK
jgi:hypothetical protein